MTINGIINQVKPKTQVSVNGASFSDINGIRQYGYDKWKMVWNGNHFAPPDVGSVLYLPGVPGFGSTIFDYSGNGNDGTITNGTWTRLASGLWAVDFNGTNTKVVCPDHASYDVQAFTMLLWVKPDDVTGQQSLMGNYTYSAGKGGFAIRLSTATIIFSQFRSQVAAANEWTNAFLVLGCKLVACTWDTANLKTYVNAVINPGGNTAEAGAMEPSDNDLSFGVRPDDQSSYALEGQIALPRLFSRALSAAEITSIYNQERPLFGV